MTKITIIGIRGIPIIYSGFESFTQNLTPELVKKKHSVIVYCRSYYFSKKPKKYKGVELVILPTIKNKYLDTYIHSLISTLHAIFILKPKIIYYMNLGNAPIIFLARLVGIRTLFNPDGLDWQREKWNFISKLYLLFCEWLATFVPNITITDSKYMKQYYWKKYKKKTVYIPYPFVNNFKFKENILVRYNLKKNKYFIWVGRMTPDNHLDELILAFIRLKTNFKCVIIGNTVYDYYYRKYIRKLTKNDKRFIFTDFLDRNNYGTLVKNAFCYIETKRSGGTHPSLIEAIGLNNNIVINDFIANKMIFKDIKNTVLFYNYKKGQASLYKQIKKLLLKRLNIYKKNNYFLEKYSLKRIVDQYEALFK